MYAEHTSCPQHVKLKGYEALYDIGRPTLVQDTLSHIHTQIEKKCRDHTEKCS